VGVPDRELGHQLPAPVTVRIFGSLRPACEAAGRPFVFDVDVAPQGVSGAELADSLGLPADNIEGIFINRVVCPLSATVHPGDRVAFVPPDTPGPHRVFLGLYSAGQADKEDRITTEGTS